MPLSTRLTASIQATHTGTTPSGALLTNASSPAAAALVLALDIALADGTGATAGVSDRLYQAQGTIAASSNVDLDLAGSLTDVFGATITFARIKGLAITAAAGNSNNLIVGAAASNQWATLFNTTGTTTLRPGGGGFWLCGSTDTAGWLVTAGTGDLLRLANSGAGSTVTYNIAVVGAST